MAAKLMSRLWLNVCNLGIASGEGKTSVLVLALGQDFRASHILRGESHEQPNFRGPHSTPPTLSNHASYSLCFPNG